MKKLILILMFGSLFAQDSPCKDETYLELKKKKLDEMSDREYQYFLNKDTQCNEFLSSINNNSINTDEISNLRTRRMLDLGGIIGIYGLTIGITIIVDEGLEEPMILVPIVGPYLLLDETSEEFVAPLIISGALQTAFLFDYIKTSGKINRLSDNISYHINPNPITPSVTFTYNFR